MQWSAEECSSGVIHLLDLVRRCSDVKYVCMCWCCVTARGEATCELLTCHSVPLSSTVCRYLKEVCPHWPREVSACDCEGHFSTYRCCCARGREGCRELSVSIMSQRLTATVDEGLQGRNVQLQLVPMLRLIARQKPISCSKFSVILWWWIKSVYEVRLVGLVYCNKAGWETLKDC